MTNPTSTGKRKIIKDQKETIKVDDAEVITDTEVIIEQDTAKVHQVSDEAAVRDAFGKDLAVLSEHIQTRNTDTGDIVFINTHYVSPKVLDIIQWYCNTQVNGFHGIYTIIFRMDGYPRVDQENDAPTSWMFFPDSCSAVCNIRGCIEVALFEAMSGDIPEAACINTWAVIWRAIVQNFFHEAHHAQAFLNEREILDSSGQKGSKARDDEEQAAIGYAQEMMTEAAKAINIELEFVQEVALVIETRIHEEMEGIDTDKLAPQHHKDWCANMKYMLKHGFITHMKSDEGHPDKSYTTLKEMMHALSGDAENDPNWLLPNPNNVCIGQSMMNPIADTVVAAGHQQQAGGFASAQQEYIVSDEGMGIDEGNWDDDGIDYSTATSQPTQQEANPGYAPNYAPATVYQTQTATGMQGAANIANGQTGPNTVVNPVTGPPAQFSTPAVNTAMVNAQIVPALNWAPDMHQAIVKGLYQKLANNIFATCQFMVGQQANTPFFMNVPGIEVPLELTAEESQLVIAMSITQNGKWMKDQPANGAVCGCAIGKAKLMPGYELVLNNGNGGQIRRKFVPQNPWNRGATAEWARNGAQIVWIIDPDAADKKFSMRVMNNVVEGNRTGQWIAV